MCSRPFVHLHNHTEYSLLDGANRIPDMVARAKELGMESLAISDHGVMFGVMEFQMECAKQGIKPIIGVEAYVAPNGHLRKTGREDNESFHLLLLAKNLEGYRNLCKLSTIAALQGYYYKPRIDHDLLREHANGIIATSTCLGSEVNQALLKGEFDRAKDIAAMYRDIFGQENYFIELQDHRLPEQAQIRGDLIRIARDLKLPLIATNDAHYLCKSDAEPHDVLLCIQTGNLIAETNRMKFTGEEFYLKSPDEMFELFSDVPEAIENTNLVAEMCDVQLGKQRANMPQPDLPEGMSSMEFLRELSQKALPDRVKGCDDEAYKRLEHELKIIETTGFSDYFLLVREFAQFARAAGIHFGVRGSAAGSLVAYSVGITDVDPLEYDLTFERFLNPERVSMPDIDMDFEDARREEMIRYVTEKYGQDHVAQIVTFGTLGAKAAIKDCGRVMGYTPQDTDRICKTIPTVPGMTIAKALKEIAEFRNLYNSDPRTKILVDTATSVEGMARHTGVHAAGVVISREPLVEHIPLYRGNDNQPITAFEMGILEKIGLLKMDFLGLANYSVIAKTVAMLKERYGENPPPEVATLIEHGMERVPFNNDAAYDMIGRGETVGVFQLESGGMTRYVKELKPRNVHELSAMVALYRPGPMEQIPKFIATKFGRAEADYMHPLIQPILEETYGIIVYQEQVQKIAQALAGFSLGKGDILRRAMGKKDKKAMDAMKVEFLDGCATKSVSAEVANKVWDLLVPFADYAFNKAHAVCYAVLAYHTAYLKANFPVEYMAALMAVYQGKEDRVVATIEECRRMKISVLPPDVNASVCEFSAETIPATKSKKAQWAIRFGLVAIKGVGQGLVEAMIQERKENGPFTHLFEFAERMKPFGLNRTALDALVRAGAMASIDQNRRKLLDMVDAALAFADTAARNRQAGQDSLFGEASGDDSVGPTYPMLPEVENYGRGELLALEKEVMGIYVSDHPLRGYEAALKKSSNQECAAVAELDEQVKVKLAGVIAALRVNIAKSSGKKMATLTLEDFSGQAAVTVFPAVYEKVAETLQKDSIVMLTGVTMHRERPGSAGEKTVEIRLETISNIDQATLDGLKQESDRLVTVTLKSATPPQVRKLMEVAQKHPGVMELAIQVMPSNSIPLLTTGRLVSPTSKFVEQIRAIVPQAQIDFAGEASEYEEGEEFAPLSA